MAVVEAPPASTGPTKTPEEQALFLLNGKDIASFFQAALPDEIIRSDAGLVNTIMNNVFVTAQIASGKVIKNEDGTHTVV